jgi:predicted amidohydrolase YtcJ
MKRTVFLLLTVASIILVVIADRTRLTLLENVHVLTVDPLDTTADSLLIQGSTIKAVGRSNVLAYLNTQTDLGWREYFKRTIGALCGVRRIDLMGRTIVPGFIDAHSHFPASGLASVGLDLSPIGTHAAKSIDELLSHVAIAAQELPQSRWVLGFNYDDALLVEGRHPTRDELDAVAPAHAVYLWHRSGHMGVANTQALRELGHDPLATHAEKHNQFGGVIGRDPSGRLNGLLQERAAPGMRQLLKAIPFWQLPKVLLRARDDYLQAGVTTVQNGYADKTTVQLLRWAQRLSIIKQRIVIWPAHNKLAKTSSQASDDGSRLQPGKLANIIDWPESDSDKLAITAIKLIADGSPQGRTAWMTKPYLPDNTLAEGYRGFPVLTDEKLHSLMAMYHNAGVQLAIHGNGDAAIDSIIRGLALAQNRTPRADSRHLIVHAQTIREDQLRSLSTLGASVSFFPSHTYFWGDWYRKRVFGLTRAARISPLRSADQLQVRFSIHSDSPVTPLLPMHMLWSATERETISGYKLGVDETISRQRALRALTIDAAWQSFLENDRGSLEQGKLADFVVLSADPLSIDDVRDVVVEQVWIGGKPVALH